MSLGAQSWQRAKDIFGEAVELRPADQAAFVKAGAAGDSEIEHEVLRLLDLHCAPDTSLDRLQPKTGVIAAAAGLHAFYAGEILAGRYRIKRYLARGGMGEVYEAEDLELGERVALKTLRADLATSNRVVGLQREIRAAGKISHPNVCRALDLVQTTNPAGQPVTFLTLELLEGETLLERLRRTGPMREREALPLVRSMVAALVAAHQAGIVHRDFKSGNVMIVPRAEGSPRVVVMDFGLATDDSRERRTSLTRTRETALTAGTPAYMAPEQIEGKRAGPAADIYALGVVLYEIMTGELPYAEESSLSMAVRKTRERPRSPQALAPTLRSTWTAAILRCMDPNPRKRPSDAREVLEAFETRSRPRMWLRWSRRPRYRWARRAGWAVLAVLLALGVNRLLPVTPDEDALEVWHQAVWALYAGEPVVAARRLENAIAERRLPVEARAHLAQAWMELGFPDRARRELWMARLEPAHTASAGALLAAVGDLLAGRNEEALRRLEQRPAADIMALADVAALAGKLGKPDAAARWLAVIAADPQNAAAHFRLAGMRAAAGEMREAAAAYLSAELYWRARGDRELVRLVSAHRGLARLSAGQLAEARDDLPSLRNLLNLPAGAGYGACEHVVELMAGVDDNFAIPYDPPALLSAAARANQAADGHSKRFDEDADDSGLRVSFPLPNVRLCSGRLDVHIRADLRNAGRLNDRITAGVFVAGGAPLVYTERAPWQNKPQIGEHVFGIEFSGDFLREVQYKSPNLGVPLLDVAIGDDTTVDYIRLTLVY